jgi:CheY-like chemotaxis protein
MFNRRLAALGGRRRAAFVLAPALVLLLAGCGGKKKPEAEVNVEPPGVLYNQALASLESGDARDASEKFQTIDTEHPYSDEARKAMIMSSFLNFRRGIYQDSINDAQRYVPLFPASEVQLVCECPHAPLDRDRAVAIGLIVNELVTNAAKYGALSTRQGSVHIGWALKSDLLVLRWTETDGPPTQTPTSPGFGMRIIRASIQGQLGGEVKFDWREEGLQCVLAVPSGSVIAAAPRISLGVKAVASFNELATSGNRVMIVEDEAVVAMALTEILTEMGKTVVGPFSRISEATDALRHNEIDAAVLDVNLGGEMVYPLADMLKANGTPFIFATG